MQKEMSAPLVSIIVVNWNGRSLLHDCLTSLYAQTFRDFEVIFVDNGSRDDSLAFVRDNFPSVIPLTLDSNRGFTGGNIAGYQIARGEYIVLLNNDACLCDHWLEYMVDALVSDPCLGFCSSKIIIAGTSLIDSAGDAFTSAFTGTKIGELSDESLYSTRVLVPGACAAAVMYRREMLDDIGFLDDDFFLNHEDTDLNMRAWLAGWRCLYVPEAVVQHKVSASIINLSETAVYFFARNNEWVWIKNVPIKQMICHLPQRILYEFASFGYFCVAKGRWRPFLRGKLDALKGIPVMLKKRKAVQALVRINNSEIDGSLISIFEYLRERVKSSFF